MTTIDEPDMTNKLGILRRQNVHRLMSFHDDTFTSIADLARQAKVSTQTMRNCFGSSPRTMPTNKTMGKLSRLFSIPEGRLDRSGFNPKDDSSAPGEKPTRASRPVEQVPVVIEQTRIQVKIGKTSIDTEVSKELAERVLMMLVMGDES